MRSMSEELGRMDIKLWQRELTDGDYIGALDRQSGIMWYGHLDINTDPQLDQVHGRFYCHKVPDGSWADLHRARALVKMTAEQFEAARAAGWPRTHAELCHVALEQPTPEEREREVRRLMREQEQAEVKAEEERRAEEAAEIAREIQEDRRALFEKFGRLVTLLDMQVRGRHDGAEIETWAEFDWSGHAWMLKYCGREWKLTRLDAAPYDHRPRGLFYNAADRELGGDLLRQLRRLQDAPVWQPTAEPPRQPDAEELILAGLRRMIREMTQDLR